MEQVLHNEEEVEGNCINADRKRANLYPIIPMDIIMEIFSWLPTKCLMRFKSLSKQFYSLIKLDPKFIEKHFNRATPVVIDVRFEDPHPVIDEKYELFDSFNGLILAKDLTSHVYHIKNPATRQTFGLPPPHEHTFEFVPFYKSLTDCKLLSSYKIMDPEAYIDIGFEILTVNKDKHWRPLKVFPGLLLPHQQHDHANENTVTTIKTTVIEGTFQIWLVQIKKYGSDMCLEIHSHDIFNECFMNSTSLPPGLFTDLNKVSVFLWNDCLAVADITKEFDLNVLVLEDLEGKKWSKSKILVPLRFLQGNNNMGMLDNLVPLQAHSDILVFERNKKYFTYDMKLERLSKWSRTKFTLKQSLVTLEGMISEE